MEIKYRRYAIRDLMAYIVILNAVVFLLYMLIPQSRLFQNYPLTRLQS